MQTLSKLEAAECFEPDLVWCGVRRASESIFAEARSSSFQWAQSMKQRSLLLGLQTLHGVLPIWKWDTVPEGVVMCNVSLESHEHGSAYTIGLHTFLFMQHFLQPSPVPPTIFLSITMTILMTICVPHFKKGKSGLSSSKSVFCRKQNYVQIVIVLEHSYLQRIECDATTNASEWCGTTYSVCVKMIFNCNMETCTTSACTVSRVGQCLQRRHMICTVSR